MALSGNKITATGAAWWLPGIDPRLFRAPLPTPQPGHNASHNPEETEPWTSKARTPAAQAGVAKNPGRSKRRPPGWSRRPRRCRGAQRVLRAPLVTVVALKPIAEEFGTSRSAPALAVSLTYIGSGMGGIAMGWIAGHVGMRRVAIVCGCMIALALTSALYGGLYQLYASNLLLIGLLGASGMFSPTMAYVTNWFDRRRGSAIALVSALARYVAGAIVAWSCCCNSALRTWVWRRTMRLYALLIVVTIPPLAAVFYRRAPDLAAHRPGAGPMSTFVPVRGIPRPCPGDAGRRDFLLLRNDVDSTRAHRGVLQRYRHRSHPWRGDAVVATRRRSGREQLWGWVADRLGGLRTILFASASMAVAMTGFLLTQNEIGLFSVSAGFGLAFGGLIPGYILAIREIFPAREASWRIPVVLFPGALGMAAGGWMAGLIYDSWGFYAPAFLAGIAFNLGNLVLVGALVPRHRPPRSRLAEV